MKKSGFIILFLFAVTLLAINANAQKNQWIFGLSIELEDKIKEIDIDIKKTKNEILKNDERIKNAEATITQAKQKGNSKLEEIAQETLKLATEAKQKNTQLLKYLEIKRNNSKYALTIVNKELLNSEYSSYNISSVISNFNGNVQIKKVNSEKEYFLENENPVFLEEGDVIITGTDSKLEMQCLGGRGNLIIGESTKLTFGGEISDEQTMILNKGKMNISVEKLEILEYKIKIYEDLLKKCKDEDERTKLEKMILYYRAKILKRFLIQNRGSYTCSIRGTQLIASEDEQKGFEVIVIEGSVDLTGNDKEQTVLVNEGYKATISTDGKISEPEIIDISKIEKWWN